MNDFNLLIDGKMVPGDQTMPVLNPATEEVLAQCPQIEAGTVWINKHLDMAPHIPFGGAKQSGIGTEFAEEGLAEFTQLQIINEARS